MHIQNSTAAINPDSKVHGANMGPIRGRQDPDGPHAGPMDFANWEYFVVLYFLSVLLPKQAQNPLPSEQTPDPPLKPCAELILGHIKYICIFLYLSALRWCMKLKSFLVEDKDLFMQYIQ